MQSKVKWQQMQWLLERLAFLMSVYTLCRVLFLVFNYNKLHGSGFANLAYAFFFGLRFDLSVVFSVNVLFVMLSMLPLPLTNHSGWQKFLKWLFVVSNIPFIFMNLADIEYFKFTGRRTSAEILKIAGDVGQQAPQLALHYWYVWLIFLIICYFLFKLYPEPAKDKAKNIGYFIGFKGWSLLVFSVVISVLLIRGFFSTKTIITWPCLCH